MSAPFRFKQFEIRQERAPMKVGTDGVLLGAWAEGGKRILDIGTGTGLLALMMAERFVDAEVVGIDINPDAILDATENVQRSSFCERINIKQCALQAYDDLPFDAIICNPPYFVRSLKSPDCGRSEARHTDTLGIGELVANSRRLLTEGGVLGVILPHSAEEEFLGIVRSNSFGIRRIMRIRPTVNAAFKRVMIQAVRGYEGKPLIDEMFIEKARHIYSDEYKALTCDFYLDKQ